MRQARFFYAACQAPKGARRVAEFHQFDQFIKAYRKDNRDYTYWQDDGTKVTLIAGEDGVTEERISQLKAAHLEERKNM